MRVRLVDPKRYIVQYTKDTDQTWRYDEVFTTYDAAEQRADMMLTSEGAKSVRVLRIEYVADSSQA